jgi:hypothetical protein
MSEEIPGEIEDMLEGNEALMLEPRGEYDSCVVGIGYRFHSGPLAVYSIPRVLRVMEGWGMTVEEAQEFFEFNTIGAWMGEGTPMFIHLFEGDGGGSR